MASVTTNEITANAGELRKALVALDKVAKKAPTALSGANLAIERDTDGSWHARTTTEWLSADVTLSGMSGDAPRSGQIAVASPKALSDTLAKIPAKDDVTIRLTGRGGTRVELSHGTGTYSFDTERVRLAPPLESPDAKECATLDAARGDEVINAISAVGKLISESIQLPALSCVFLSIERDPDGVPFMRVSGSSNGDGWSIIRDVTCDGLASEFHALIPRQLAEVLSTFTKTLGGGAVAMSATPANIDEKASTTLGIAGDGWSITLACSQELFPFGNITLLMREAVSPDVRMGVATRDLADAVARVGAVHAPTMATKLTYMVAGGLRLEQYTDQLGGAPTASESLSGLTVDAFPAGVADTSVGIRTQTLSQALRMASGAKELSLGKGKANATRMFIEADVKDGTKVTSILVGLRGM